MTIKKNKDNTFDIKGISKGKLIAILNAIEGGNVITTLGKEVRDVIKPVLKED